MREPFAKTEVRHASVPPLGYVATPPCVVFVMDLAANEVLRRTLHQTLAEAVADLARFNLPFMPYRAAGIFDSEYQEVLAYVAFDRLELHGTDESFVELAKHRPHDEVALWQAQATLAATLPVAEEQAWSPST
jgi:hypothetical protein